MVTWNIQHYITYYTGFLANGLNIQNHRYGSLNTWVNREVTELCVLVCL